MSIKYGSIPVGTSQKVAANQKESDAKKPLAVSWDRTTATVGQTVEIKGVVNVPVNSPFPPTVVILFNGNVHIPAENIKIQNGQITAQWRVFPARSGSFTDGVYDVEIKYAGLLGRTSTALKIVRVGGDPNASSFGR